MGGGLKKLPPPFYALFFCVYFFLLLQPAHSHFAQNILLCAEGARSMRREGKLGTGGENVCLAYRTPLTFCLIFFGGREGPCATAHDALL